MKRTEMTEETVTIEFSRFEAVMIMCALGTEVDFWRNKKETSDITRDDILSMVECKREIYNNFMKGIKRD
jgi:hypothetical protein